MKTRTLILIFLIIAVLIIAGSCATDPMKYISKDYEIYGTWVNPDYNEKRVPAKVVYYPNDKIEAYARETSTFEQFTGKFYITNKWNDSEGNSWYTIIAKFPFGNEYVLAKISNSGKTLEWVWSTNDYPTEVNPNIKYGTYETWNRQ